MRFPNQRVGPVFTWFPKSGRGFFLARMGILVWRCSGATGEYETCGLVPELLPRVAGQGAVARCEHAGFLRLLLPLQQLAEIPEERGAIREGGEVLAIQADVTSEADIISFCKSNMAGFKVPKTVIFGPLPKTSTGKIQKFLLREEAWKGHEKRIQG